MNLTGSGGGTGAAVTSRLARPPAPPANTADAVDVRNNRLYLNLTSFFKDHKTQLLVTLRRAD
jgi:hypothetical protein